MRSLVKRSVGLTAALLAGVALSQAVGSPGAGAAPAAATAPGISWGQCADSGLKAAHAQCAMISVPLDYAHPLGAHIKIAISRIEHTVSAAKYQGIMLVNPGGPGGSGLTLSTLGSYVPNGVGGDYDWIGFDPRGVGSSVPAVRCNPQYFDFNRAPYVPTTPAIERAWLKKVNGYSAACKAKNGPILRNMTTIDSARDMDQIRAALGANQLNYYGFSYGTYLGQVYATLYPNRVRRMVLDSNVDPRSVWYESNLQQDQPFDRNVDIWFGWLAKYDSVYHLGRTEKAVRTLWYATQAKLAKHPAGGKIGPSEWTDDFLNAGYYQVTWTSLGSLFANYIHKNDYKSLESAYIQANGLGDDNAYAAYLAVQCTDAPWPTSWATWARDNSRINKTAPFETWGNAWYNAPCRTWPAPAQRPVPIGGRKVASTLLIDETLDAATPYEGSLEVRKLFPHSSLIALPGGTSHANSLNGDRCLDDKIAAYLATGALPARRPGNGPDATCAPLPQPVPGHAAVSTSAPASAPSGVFSPSFELAAIRP